MIRVLINNKTSRKKGSNAKSASVLNFY